MCQFPSGPANRAARKPGVLREPRGSGRRPYWQAAEALPTTSHSSPDTSQTSRSVVLSARYISRRPPPIRRVMFTSPGTVHQAPLRFFRSLQVHQGDIVLLFPILTGEVGELGEEEVDQRRFVRVVRPYQALQPREAEHLVVRVVRLNQPVAVKQDALAPLKGDLLLLVFHPRHQAQGHPSRPELLHITAVMPQVRQVVASVGKDETPAVGIEDGIQAGDEHVGRDVYNQRFVRPLQDLRRWEETLGRDTQHGAGRRHYQRGGYALVGHITNDETEASIVQLE